MPETTYYCIFVTDPDDPDILRRLPDRWTNRRSAYSAASRHREKHGGDTVTRKVKPDGPMKRE